MELDEQCTFQCRCRNHTIDIGFKKYILYTGEVIGQQLFLMLLWRLVYDR